MSRRSPFEQSEQSEVVSVQAGVGVKLCVGCCMQVIESNLPNMLQLFDGGGPGQRVLSHSPLVELVCRAIAQGKPLLLGDFLIDF